VEIDVVKRYAARVMRFQAKEYRACLKRKCDHGNPDEEEFKSLMNLYLHDAGLNPLSEVPSGNARTDALTVEEPVMAYEAKVIRKYDSKARARGQVVSGLRQACTYRRHWDAGVAHFVLFDAWEHGVELPDLVDIDGAQLAIHHIDLRDSPSGRKGPKVELRWSPEEVVAVALG